VTTELSTLRGSCREALMAAGVPSPEADTEQILAAALRLPRSSLAFAPAATPEQAQLVAEMTARRARREPLQHIVGGTGFRQLWLAVGPGVFIPRPETEGLVQAVLDQLTETGGPADAGVTEGDPVVVDLCAGSGAVGLAIATERPGTRVIAVELDPAAVSWLRRNADDHAEAIRAVGSDFRLVVADLLDEPLVPITAEVAAGTVSVVVSNPPYIPVGAVPRDPEVRDYDPPVALYGGRDGLAVVRPLIDVAAVLLAPGGMIAIEHGDDQGDDTSGPYGVPDLLRAHGGFDGVRDLRDLAGRPRVTVARLRQ
jgi:release factor glutamine methyltransferase